MGGSRRVQGDRPWTAGKKEMGTLILFKAGTQPAKAQGLGSRLERAGSESGGDHHPWVLKEAEDGC